jgi:hypothetical protein
MVELREGSTMRIAFYADNRDPYFFEDEGPVCDQSYFLKSFETEAPNYSECAFTGKSALSWAPWIPFLSGGFNYSPLNLLNLELSHEHIFFEQSKENIGWGHDGFFTEAKQDEGYKLDKHCYDGSIIRKILGLVETNREYKPFTNNCQMFVSKIRSRYFQRLKELMKK